MEKTKKITKRERFNQLLAMEEVKANAGMVEFINHELELLDRKNASGEKKLTAVQIENNALKEVIVTTLNSNKDYLWTVTELIKKVKELNELSNQKVSQLMRQLNEVKRIERVEDGRKTFFRAIR